MNIIIASGKGGTGKTTFAVNLAYYLSKDKNKNVKLLDGDVEEPNDHLFLPTGEMHKEDVNVLKPEFNSDNCTSCGKCVENCTFNALALVNGNILFFNELCHACGACSFVCENQAVLEKPTSIGKIYSEEATSQRPFAFAYGILNIGESLAPSVVKQLKKHLLIEKDEPTINILDASPGTACPVVEALSGDNNLAVLVTEPTPFGLNDLKLAAELSLNLENPTGIVINRSDGEDRIIADFAEENNIPILGRIPFARKYAETYSRGEILIQKHQELDDVFANIFLNIQKLAKAPKPDKLKLTKLDTQLQKKEFAKGSAEDFNEIVVISGKGGTGKTTITSSLNQLCEDNVIFDADVDAADLHLLLKPKLVKNEIFSGSNEFYIDPEKCYGCGQCAKNCHFEAISLSGPGNDLIDMTYKIDPLLCEGCSLCKTICPVDAISSEPAHTGDLFQSAIKSHAMIHAKLDVGGENSGKLVSKVRGESADFANEYKMPFILGDGPPGTSCPVIASVTGSDLVLMVTEPTVSGVHDLERVMQLVQHFNIKSLIIINKADLNPGMTVRIHQKAAEFNSKVIAEIPFDRNIHDSLMLETTIVEYGKGAAAKIIAKLWDKIKKEMGKC